MIAALTDLERDYLKLDASGLTDREIAKQMLVSLFAVKTMLAVIRRKLHARNSVELAYRTGLVR